MTNKEIALIAKAISQLPKPHNIAMYNAFLEAFHTNRHWLPKTFNTLSFLSAVLDPDYTYNPKKDR